MAGNCDGDWIVYAYFLNDNSYRRFGQGKGIYVCECLFFLGRHLLL